MDWSSEVPSLLRGHAADEHDPLQREYFRVNELYTRRLSTRLADDRDSSDRFLRLVCQARWAGVEENRAVELVLDETHIQGAEPLGRLQLFAQDDDTPTQSRPEWLWRLNDGIIESRVDGYAMCLQQDKSIRARQLHRADLSKQSWTLTDQGQLQHNDTGLLLGVDGQFLVARTAADLGVGVGSGDTMSSPSIKWAIHRHDVQTLRVQVRAKRTSKWRDAKQRMIVATVGRYERAALLAMEDSNRNARLPPAELEALNIQLETLIEDGHGLRDLLLVVQALAESKFEAGQVRQCVRVYMAAARRLLQEVQVDSGQTEDEPQPESQPEPEPEPEPESRRATESEPEPEPEQVALSTEVVSAEHGDSTEAVVMAYPAEESGDAATEKKDLTKELSEDQSAASIGSKLNRATTRTSVHAVASKNNGVPDYVKRLQTMQHANAHDVAAELEREHAAHASTTQELEESLRAALAIPVDAPLEERCAAFRQAFCGRAISTQPLTSMQIIPDHGLELHRLPRDLLMKRGSSKSSANPSTEKEFWPIFRNTYTGLPCLGRNVVLKQIEPPPVVIDDDGKETEIVDCHTARKIQFGPLPERDGRPGEMWELQWDQEGKKDWPALLRVLQQLTGQVAWHRTVHSHRAELDFEDDDDTHIEENAVDSENQQEIMAPRQMCSSSQFSFTIPPTVCDRSAFLIRVRFGADTKLIGGSWKWQTDDTADARGWINPLTWRNGDYFSPKFRRQTEYFVRPDRAEVLPPPPVVLGKTWESAHIIKHDHDDTIEREGDLRIFSILGLTPSCTANGAKVFGYGASRVEVEIATAYGMTWEEANLEDNLWIWKVAYDVPPEPIGTVLVKTFVEAMRYRGLPAIEESLMGQVDRNRKRNIKVIREFVEESWEKLQPWYAYKVQPWLASHSLTYLLVDESRAMLLREKTRFLLDKLGVSIPVEFKRDRPMIETVIVRAVPQGTIMLQWENARGVIIPERFGRSRFGRGAAGRATAPLEAIITTGQAFSVEAVALRSPVEHEEPAAHARWRALRRLQLGGDSEESSAYVYRRKVQLWWHVARASELLPDEIKDPQIMIGGQRLDGTQVPVQSFRECNVSPVRICVPVADERDEFAPCFSQLNFRGVRDGTLYPVHDADTEFVLQLTAVEEGAHEMHSLDILFRIVADEQADVADRASAGSEDRWENAQNAIGQRQSQDTPNTRSESDDEDESDNEISNEDEWPPLDLGTPPDVGDMLARIPERFESLLLVFRDGVYSRLDVPRPWGLRLEDSVSWSVMQRSFERATLRWLRTSLGQNQLPPAWTGTFMSRYSVLVQICYRVFHFQC